jgi:dipeptidyl aminopeptidase/acylaminoacyl peptidase
VAADAPESAGDTPFHDLNDYIAIPRLTGLRLSPDGSWLAATVQSLSADKKKYVTSIWRIDTGGGPPARLTRSAEGEGSPRFLPDGALLFTSKRPDPERKNGKQDADDSGTALWLLPSGGGEARSVAAVSGGISGVQTAASASTIVVTASALPGAAEQDEQRRKARKDAGVTAILHETLPVRYWDHDLGPDDPRLFVGPDGGVIVTGWWHWRERVQAYSELVRIDVATGQRTTISGDGDGDGDGDAAGAGVDDADADEDWGWTDCAVASNRYRL